MKRNRYYSPRSTAWASEGERSHAGLKVFEVRCRGAILHACLAENVLSGDKNRRYVSRNPATRRVLLSSLYVCPGRNCWKKVSRRKLLTYRRLLSTTASFSARWAEGREPDGVPEAKRSQGQQPLRQTCSRLRSPASLLRFGLVRAVCSLSPHRAAATQFAAPRLPRFGPMRTACGRDFPASALCEHCGSAPSPLRPRRAACGLKPRCYRAVPRRLLACRLSRTRRA